ncbi:nuclear transport factor 2 family protein [Dyadobacter sp. SG02]|uniref:nuclear transport factor 2 family protein n=1 Tax=Dyadobacter sp. SG02 TaxID=1855291 RepID=UPI00115FA959|nr:nuclear transport factor 2 family protein [Dyadobacter sp. SG02]
MNESRLLNAQPAEQVAAQFFAALTSRDFNAVCGCFAEEREWYIPGNKMIAPWLDERMSRHEVREFYQLLWANTETVSGRIDYLAVDSESRTPPEKCRLRTASMTRFAAAITFLLAMSAVSMKCVVGNSDIRLEKSGMSLPHSDKKATV